MARITHRTRKVTPAGKPAHRPVVVKVLTASGKTIYRHFHPQEG